MTESISNLAKEIRKEFDAQFDELECKVEDNLAKITRLDTRTVSNLTRIEKNENRVKNLAMEVKEVQDEIKKVNILKIGADTTHTLTESQLMGLFTVATSERKEYRNAVSTRARNGHLTVVVTKPDGIITIPNPERPNDFTVDVPALLAKLGNGHNLASHANIFEKFKSINDRYIIKLQLTGNNILGKKEIVERIIRQRAVNKGQIGVSIDVPAKFDIDTMLGYLVRTVVDSSGKKIFKKFSVDTRGFYYVLLNDVTQQRIDDFITKNEREPKFDNEIYTTIHINQPLSFCELKTENMTHDKMIQLKNFKNFFIAKGDVLKRPTLR